MTDDTVPVPRSGEVLESIVIEVMCEQCFAYKGRLCHISMGPAPPISDLHFVRYEKAFKIGLITKDELEQARIHMGSSRYVMWKGAYDVSTGKPSDILWPADGPPEETKNT